MIRLIATDLDNTLLDASGSLPASTAKMLADAAALGVIIAISTGRSYLSAKGIADQYLPLLPFADDEGDGCRDHSHAICYNGSQIRDLTNGGMLYSESIPEDLFYPLIDFAHANDLYLELYDRDGIVVEKLDLTKHPDPDLAFAPYREAGDLSASPFFRTPKMLMADDPARIPEKQALLEETFAGKIFCAQSAPHIIEIMPAHVNKGVALGILQEKLGIQKEETMALGDNTNDSHLLAASGLAVAVANAVPSLKDAADYVCEEERNLGVEEALRRFIL